MNISKSSLKPILLFILLTVFTQAGAYAQATATPAKAAEPAVLDTTKYSVKIPAGWKHFDKAAGQFSALFIMAPADNNFSPNLNIIMAETGNITMDEFFNGNADDMKKNNMVLDTAGDFEANGLKGKFYSTKIDHGGLNIAIKSYLLLKNGIGYVLSTACLSSQKSKYYPTFEDIVQSFKVK